MGAAEFSIRRATADDAALVSALAARTFTETFGHLYPAADLRHFLEHSYAPEAQRRSLEDSANAMWLLEVAGEVVGHAYAGRCTLPHPAVAPGDGELKRLYLLAQAHNRGWGGHLFQAALDWLQRDGPRTLWVGVWSENLGAQRFYARHGFDKVGDYEFPVGQTRDHEFILRRPPQVAAGG